MALGLFAWVLRFFQSPTQGPNMNIQNIQKMIAKMNATLQAAYEARLAEQRTAERRRTERIVNEYRTQRLANEAANALHAAAMQALKRQN